MKDRLTILAASDHGHATITGSCASCHNGSRAAGQNATHGPVGAQSCDACHRTGGSWRPSSFNHTQMVVANQCASCHSGGFPPADDNHLLPVREMAATEVLLQAQNSGDQAKVGR